MKPSLSPSARHRWVVATLTIALTFSTGPLAAAANPPEPGSVSQQIAPAERAGTTDDAEVEGRALPFAVGYFVVVTVRGGHAVRVGVRARNAAKARKAAETLARKRGYRDARSTSVVRGGFKTGPRNYKIQFGKRIRQEDGFVTFRGFKARYGNAPRGYEWHHIVEQSARVAGRLPNRRYIHHPNNVLAIPAGIHRKCVNSFMNKKIRNLDRGELRGLKIRSPSRIGHLTLRQSLDGYGYRNHHLIGLRLLRYCGVDVSARGL